MLKTNIPGSKTLRLSIFFDGPGTSSSITTEDFLFLFFNVPSDSSEEIHKVK